MSPRPRHYSHDFLDTEGVQARPGDRVRHASGRFYTLDIDSHGFPVFENDAGRWCDQREHHPAFTIVDAVEEARIRLSVLDGPTVFLNGEKLVEGEDYEATDPKNGLITIQANVLVHGHNTITLGGAIMELQVNGEHHTGEVIIKNLVKAKPNAED